jgi:flagellar protein FliO/FliZ
MSFDWFGAEMPLAVRFLLAFLIVLGLIGATAWAVRRFGSGRIGGSGMRGRQPRLAVIDHASVDARRRLILVRRDNVEHLLMIGGPADVVVETNIVRGTPAARELPAGRPPGAVEALARAMPLPETGSNGSWPLQPEPSGPSGAPVPPRRAPRAEPMAEDQTSALPPHVETPARPQREALAALADDLAGRPGPPVTPTALVTPAPPRNRAAAVARSPEPRVDLRPEPRAVSRVPVQPANTEAMAAADQTLAEMAQRLEAALRKPKSAEGRTPQPPSAPARTALAAEHPTASEAPAPPPPPTAAVPPSPPGNAADANPTRADAKAKEGKALYETLEQEMANLLGRPPSKTG